MNGVDVLDQYLSSYDKQFKSDKWTLQNNNTGWTLLEVSCFPIHKIICGIKQVECMDHLTFKQTLARQLLQKTIAQKESANTLSSSQIGSEKLNKTLPLVEIAISTSSKCPLIPLCAEILHYFAASFFVVGFFTRSSFFPYLIS